MIFRALFRGKTKSTLAEEHLPAQHSFVDVSVNLRPSRSVSVEAIGPQTIVVGDALGRPGEKGVFIYSNAAGRFRFASLIAEIKDGMTHFNMPARIDAVSGGSQKRASVRVDTLIAGAWRVAPAGEGVGEFLKGNIRDISRGGCALIIDRQCKVGARLEVKLFLQNDAAPLQVLGEVVRCERIPTSGKFSHGLRFLGLSAEEDGAVLEFINRRQAQLRSRGLA